MMTIGNQVGNALRSTTAFARRGTRRGIHEAQVRKLRWEIERHKGAIGQAIYPLLETGTLQIDIPEVQEELARIRERHERIRELEQQHHAQRLERRADGTTPADDLP